MPIWIRHRKGSPAVGIRSDQVLIYSKKVLVSFRAIVPGATAIDIESGERGRAIRVNGCPIGINMNNLEKHFVYVLESILPHILALICKGYPPPRRVGMPHWIKTKHTE